MATTRRRSLPQVIGLALVAAICAGQIAWQAPQVWRAVQIMRLAAELKRRGGAVGYPIPAPNWMLTVSLQGMAAPLLALALVIFAVGTRRYWVGWLAGAAFLVWSVVSAILAFKTLLG